MAHTAVVVTVSDRAAAGEYADRSGPLLVAGLEAMGLEVTEAVVVADGEPVIKALSAAIRSAVDVIVTTGGTGLGPRDVTPECTKPFLSRELPHLAAAIAARGIEAGVPSAVLSRGLCGVSGRTLIVNLAGSTGAVRDGLAVLADVLPHAIEQLAGGGHDD